MLSFLLSSSHSADYDEKIYLSTDYRLAHTLYHLIISQPIS
jgi:hypothetical protein